MAKGSSKAAGDSASGSVVAQITSAPIPTRQNGWENEVIESGSYKGVTRGVLKQAVDNNVEVLVGDLNTKYVEGKTFTISGKEYTVTKGAKFAVDSSDRVTISFTGERQTKTESISREYNAVLLPGDGVNAAHMGFTSHKDTKTPIKKKKTK